MKPIIQAVYPSDQGKDYLARVDLLIINAVGSFVSTWYDKEKDKRYVSAEVLCSDGMIREHGAILKLDRHGVPMLCRTVHDLPYDLMRNAAAIAYEQLQRRQSDNDVS